MNTPAPDSVARSAAGREANGREANGSTPKVVVTTRSIPRTRFGSTATRLFRDPWTPTRVLRSQVSQFKNLKVWRAAALEGIFTGTWILISILIVTDSVAWGPHLLGRTYLVVGFFHFLLFTIYTQATTTITGGQEPGFSVKIPSLNPAITFLQMLTGIQGLVGGFLVMVAQFVGAILASLCAKELLPQDRIDNFMLAGCVGRRTVLDPTGTPIVIGFSDHKYFLVEFVFSFTFLYITSLLSTQKQLRVLGLKVVVLLISANIGFNVYLSAGLRPGYGGSTFNPARCLGPAVAYGQPLWNRLWPAFVAPYVAAFAVAFLFATLPPDHVEVYETKNDVISKFRRWSKTPRRPNFQSTSSQHDDNDLEDNTVYEVPSAGRLFSTSPETPDLRPPPEISHAV